MRIIVFRTSHFQILKAEGTGRFFKNATKQFCDCWWGESEGLFGVEDVALV